MRIATEPRALSIEAAAADTLVATIPSWRHDLSIDDIAEEVARVRGYELVPSILPDTPMPHHRPRRSSSGMPSGTRSPGQA